MPRAQRVAQYIQELAYASLFKQEEPDEQRPQDVPPRVPEPNYPSWSATSFAVYVPFRSPTND